VWHLNVNLKFYASIFSTKSHYEINKTLNLLYQQLKNNILSALITLRIEVCLIVKLESVVALG